MKRVRVQHFILIGLVLLAAASMFPSIGGGSKRRAPIVRTERARYAAASGPAHPHPQPSDPPPARDTWAER